MQGLINLIRREIAAMTAGMPQPCWGIVTSVDPKVPAAKVLLKPGDIGTGWCPINLPVASGGWSLIAIPAVGDMAFLVPDSGSSQHYVIVGFSHHDGNRPPMVPNTAGVGGAVNTTDAPLLSGEVALVNKAGAVWRLNADGSIYGRGDIHQDGTLYVNGDVYDRHGSLNRLRVNYNDHVHTQGADAHGDAEAPTNTTSLPDPE